MMDKHALLAQERLAAAFKAFDSDGSGMIELAEMQSAVLALGLPISKQRVAQLFCEADVDRSGTIDFNEFCSVMDKGANGPLARILQRVADDKNAADYVRQRARPTPVDMGSLDVQLDYLRENRQWLQTLHLHTIEEREKAERAGYQDRPGFLLSVFPTDAQVKAAGPDAAPFAAAARGQAQAGGPSSRLSSRSSSHRSHRLRSSRSGGHPPHAALLPALPPATADSREVSSRASQLSSSHSLPSLSSATPSLMRSPRSPTSLSRVASREPSVSRSASESNLTRTSQRTQTRAHVRSVDAHGRVVVVEVKSRRPRPRPPLRVHFGKVGDEALAKPDKAVVAEGVRPYG